MAGELLEKIVDEIIALFVVIASIIFIFTGKELPEWWITAFGIIIAYYFTKKVIKKQEKT